MSSYIIAGGSDKVDTAEVNRQDYYYYQCENMANLIRQYYPDISFKIVLKDQTQWEQYVDEICRIYGFKQKSNPIIYTMDGILIGDRNAFIQLAETRFGLVDPKLRQGPITPDVNKKIAKNELDQKLKLQSKKLTLIEKIEQKMLKLYVDEIVNPTEGVLKQSYKANLQENIKIFIEKMSKLVNPGMDRSATTEGIFQQNYVNGMKFYYKFDNRLRPIKKIEELLFKEEKMEIIEQENTVLAEVKEDGEKVIKSVPWFHDKFLTLEQHHIQQQLELAQQQKERESQASHKNSLHVDVEKNNISKDLVSPKALQSPPIPILEKFEEDDGGQLDDGGKPDKQSPSKIEQQNGENNQIEQNGEQERQDGEQPQEQVDQNGTPLVNDQVLQGDEIPEGPELEQVISVLGGQQQQIEEIEILEEDQTINKPHNVDISELYLHKFRNGYAVVLHPFPLVDGQLLICRPENDEILDYSCIRRGRVNSYKRSSTSAAPEGLYESQIDIFKSVTLNDCEMVAKLINKCDAVVVLNILPQELQSFLPLSNGHYTAILRHHAELSKESERLFKHLTFEKQNINYKQLLPIEQFILDQRSQCYEVYRDIHKMKQLTISHYLSFPGNVITGESLYDQIVRIIGLCLDQESNCALKMGYNLVITKYLIFFYPTFTNYEEMNGHKLHLTAFSSLGFLNLPTGVSSNYFELIQKAQMRKC